MFKQFRRPIGVGLTKSTAPTVRNKIAKADYLNERLVHYKGKFVDINRLNDQEIINNSSFPMQFPKDKLPITDVKEIIPETRARKYINKYYTQFKELYNKHRNEVWFDNYFPFKSPGAWVAPNATIIGNVQLGIAVNVWYGSVIRGDKNLIKILDYTNIQDGVVITAERDEEGVNLPNSVFIGAYTTVGHGARLHSCTIGENCVIGMGATILEGAVVEGYASVAAGSLVPPGRRIPSGELWGGNPIRFLRKIGPNEKSDIEMNAKRYYEVAHSHDLSWTSYSEAYKEVEDLINKMTPLIPEKELSDGLDAEVEKSQYLAEQLWQENRKVVN